MPGRHRPSSRRRAAALLLALLAPLVPALGQVTAAVTINPCIISPSSCATVWIEPLDNGTGTVSSTTSLGGVSDDLITCRRSGGVTWGNCSHTYFIGSSGSITLYFSDTPANGSRVCALNVCQTTRLNFQYTLPLGPGAIFKPTFQLLDPVTLHVSVDGGTGTITSSPIGIDCGNICGVAFAKGHTINITIAPDSGEVFRGWSVGPCQGQGTTCSFVIDAETTVAAKVASSTPAPTPSPTPAPTAAATAKPTPKPTATATVGPTSSVTPTSTTPGSSSPAATDQSSGAPGSGTPGETAAATGPAGSAAGSPAPQVTDSNGAAPSSDLSPTGNTGGSGGSSALILAVAIVVAGALVSLGLFASRRRRTPTRPG